MNSSGPEFIQSMSKILFVDSGRLRVARLASHTTWRSTLGSFRTLRRHSDELFVSRYKFILVTSSHFIGFAKSTSDFVIFLLASLRIKLLRPRRNSSGDWFHQVSSDSVIFLLASLRIKLLRPRHTLLESFCSKCEFPPSHHNLLSTTNYVLRLQHHIWVPKKGPQNYTARRKNPHPVTSSP